MVGAHVQSRPLRAAWPHQMNAKATILCSISAKPSAHVYVFPLDTALGNNILAELHLEFKNNKQGS